MNAEELKIIISAEIDRLKDELKQGQKELNNFEKKGSSAGQKFGKAMGAMAKATGTALKAVGAAFVAAAGAVVGLAESTKEYRTEQAKLKTAFQAAGSDAKQATKTYNELYRVLGDSGQATEAASHLAQLTTNSKELEQWTKITQGVYATFGDSLPIESLTEAANETAKTGELTGALADALNWAGVAEADFQAQLLMCNTEAEREALIRETLNGIYSDAADKYEENAKSILDANAAQAQLTAGLAELGGAVEPIVTLLKAGLANALTDLVPHFKLVTDGLNDVVNGVEGGAAKMSQGITQLIGSILTTITEALPLILQVGVDIIAALIEGIVASLPAVMQALSEIIPVIITKLGELIPLVIEGILQALPLLLETIILAASQILETLGEILPEILASIVAIIPQLIDTLVENIPILLEAAVSFLMAIVEAIPLIIPPLLEALPSIIDSILDMLTENIPVLLDAGLALLMAIVDAIPLLIPVLVEAIPQIIDSIIDFLIDNFPVLLQAGIDIFMALVEAIPKIIPQLIVALGQIVFTVIQNLANKLGDVFSSIWDGITSIFNGVGDFFGTIFRGAADIVKNAWSGIGSFFQNLWNGILNTGKGLINGIITIFEKGLNAIIRLINNITGGLSSIWTWTGLPAIPKIPEAHFPRLARGGVLEKGQIGLLEGSGAEAVVPLEHNTEWITKVADMLGKQMKGFGDRPLYLVVNKKVLGQVTTDSINDITKSTGKIPLVFA